MPEQHNRQAEPALIAMSWLFQVEQRMTIDRPRWFISVRIFSVDLR